MANSKIIFGGQVLIDLTSDTVDPQSLLVGHTAHGSDGELVEGACDFDTNTTDATAKASEILLNKTAYVNKTKVTGTMPNRGAYKTTITTKSGTPAIPQGYHDGTGYMEIDPTEQAKIVPDNIRAGVTILGVVGEMSGTEDATPQAKEVTPTVSGFEVLPDTGYNYLSQVTVKPIPYSESANAGGGITVTIA